MKGLQLSSGSDAIADHSRYRQYNKTIDEVRIDASSLVLRKIRPLKARPATNVTIRRMTFPPHPENQMNSKIAITMFAMLIITVSMIRTIPEHPKFPPSFSKFETRVELIL